MNRLAVAIAVGAGAVGLLAAPARPADQTILGESFSVVVPSSTTRRSAPASPPLG